MRTMKAYLCDRVLKVRVRHARRWTALLTVMVAVAAMVVIPASASPTRSNSEFRGLASSPYPMQHVDPRASDFVERKAPLQVKPAWRALNDSMIAQPCSSGPNGDLYCTRAWAHPETDKCNLVALDGKTGTVRWEDRVNGSCLLDEYAWITNPTIDTAGNLYVADSKLIASFSATGRLRWINREPSKLVSSRGLPNNPFGLSLLPNGDLVTATMGDGYVLVLDRANGKLISTPFALPSDKQRVAGAGQAPPGFVESIASPGVGPVLFDIGLGISNYQVDNNVAVDTHTGLIFVTGGAPAPNPNNDGALWAVRYNERTKKSAVAFFVRFPGPGGIATTPTVTKDGNYVLVGDNQNNFVAVNLRACAKVSAGNPCTSYASAPTGGKLGASVTVTPDNRVYFPLATQGLVAYDITQVEGQVKLTQVFKRSFPGMIISTVLTGFNNSIYFGLSSPFTGEHFLIAVDPDTGQTISSQPSCDFANVTMGANKRTLYTNCINFQDELTGRHREAGVEAWIP